MSLIQDILKASARRLAERRAKLPEAELRARAAVAPRASMTFREALQAQKFSIIAEHKRRSPSGGAMDAANVSNALAVYRDTPSISAISVLTDQDYFEGSLEDLQRARKSTNKPLLRKDFIVDDYQVWEARACGADAILLMAALHADDGPRMLRLFELATSLGMDVLFEIGMSEAPIEEQCRIIPNAATIVGVNSRRFKTATATLGSFLGKDLSTDQDRHRALRSCIPDGKLAVAESGIHQPPEVRTLQALRYNAALIGTAFLKGPESVANVVAGFQRELS